ncbi:hypothetical protein ABIE13_004346 [Ottowia thiooxydans]|uniref:Uncharacterized protein n=1 Tax=Ottowia thiooxydans TaxID=219182 RepID=A0ABV2QF92_9BURK
MHGRRWWYWQPAPTIGALRSSGRAVRPDFVHALVSFQACAMRKEIRVRSNARSPCSKHASIDLDEHAFFGLHNIGRTCDLLAGSIKRTDLPKVVLSISVPLPYF